MKKSFIQFLPIAASVVFFTINIPLNGFESADCSDGLPRRSCKIWDVEYTPPPGGNGQIKCSTGGDWQCFLAPDKEGIQ